MIATQPSFQDILAAAKLPSRQQGSYIQQESIPIIAVDHLVKTFRTKRKSEGLSASFRSLWQPEYTTSEAVKDISFTVEPGETLAFIGPNGAGKSTTIKMLVGILYPTSGFASVLGLVSWQQRTQLAYNIGTVFGQKSQLWYHLPPIDTFGLFAKIYEIPEAITSASAWRVW